MQEALKIPSHNCQNCGACCGPIMATKAEIVAIKQYVSKLARKEVQRLNRQHIGEATCQFRDDENRKCVIYPVRPEVCRLMGVVRGLVCVHGNSENLNGHRLIDMDKERFALPEIIRRKVSE